MRIHEPTARSTSVYERIRVALSICFVLAFLLVWAIWMGLGAGGFEDYALFFLWALFSTVGIYSGDRVFQRPIWGSVFAGIVGILVFFGYWNSGFTIAQIELAFGTQSIVPLLHLHPAENVFGEMVILLMGILASLILGAAARLAGEGLAIGVQNVEEVSLPRHSTSRSSNAQL